MTVYLLDINILLALSDPMHVHHDAAHRWFAKIGKEGWATCPITENGYVRIASHPNYPNCPGNVSTVLAILQQFCSAEGHHFWAEDISITTLLQPDVVVSHNQVTDLYLLGLAVHKGGKLATLDHLIPAKAVQGGTRALKVIDT